MGSKDNGDLFSEFTSPTLLHDHHRTTIPTWHRGGKMNFHNDGVERRQLPCVNHQSASRLCKSLLRTQAPTTSFGKRFAVASDRFHVPSHCRNASQLQRVRSGRW